jgi:hypothetical protein
VLESLCIVKLGANWDLQENVEIIGEKKTLKSHPLFQPSNFTDGETETQRNRQELGPELFAGLGCTLPPDWPFLFALRKTKMCH